MAKLDELVVSPYEWDTQDEAFADLDRINKKFPSQEGWKKVKSWIERTPSGKWRAYSCHIRNPD